MNSTFAALFKKYRLRSEFGTLSELADAMAEEGYVYEYSLYSHWQKGDRLPNRKTLLALTGLFIKRKGISAIDEVNQLLSSAGEGYLTESEILRFGFNDSQLYDVRRSIEESFRGIDAIEHMTLFHKMLRRARLKGHDQFVLETIDSIISKGYSYAINERQEKIKQNHSILIVRLLYEKAHLVASCNTPESSLPMIQQIMQEQQRLVQNYKSSELYGMIQFPLSICHYIAGDYYQSAHHHQISLQIAQEIFKLPNIYDEIYFQSLRVIVANSIGLKDESLLDASAALVNKEVAKDENKTNADYIVSSMREVCRGQAHFHRKKALNTFEQSNELENYSQWRDQYRDALLIRTEIEVSSRFDKKKDSDFIKKRAEEGLQIANQHQIARYQKVFGRYL